MVCMNCALCEQLSSEMVGSLKLKKDIWLKIKKKDLLSHDIIIELRFC